ncbi:MULTISPECIES: helix-turn-helix transcriptional regulator [unclassified Arthrobacter]|uniref:helix-turn-helix domain-containing protein n=1 Tax=unclassified Arthrobacter TaxID=235627 RepID=UPI00159D6197|nr:helix-turn-helix transcriptional regulator [Arthrobacter sp. STN4]MCQ9164834.1 helix-turn-helix domain-containing protein [Arthrobacter sp. STN4]NVM98717.1 helix-turn-helix transcriptional regulator [Arthrobacter sp. SDTb3-6]
MGSSFGVRLRQERLARNLTQSELGGALYSASYISLLENGRREPTVEIIKQLSLQLQLAPHSIEEWMQPISAEESGYLIASLYARQCWDTRDYVGAAQSAGAAAEKALASHDAVTWWNMAYLQANSLLRCGGQAEALEVLQALLGHALTSDSDALTLRTRQSMSSALLSLGRLPEAIEEATLAVEIGSGDTDEEYTAYLIAMQTLVGALAEAGDLEAAWQHCLTLAEAVTDATPSQLAGEIHWVIGNVAFIRQDVNTGLFHHAQAGRLLSPTQDLARWAQFNKATAWVRLAAGIVEPATLEAIERSELAHSVVGATRTETLEVVLLRARWLYLNGDMTGALALLESIGSERETLATHIAGDTAMLLGKVLKAQDRTEEALAAFNEAKARFTEAGATDKISQVTESIVEIESLRRSGSRSGS